MDAVSGGPDGRILARLYRTGSGWIRDCSGVRVLLDRASLDAFVLLARSQVLPSDVRRAAAKILYEQAASIASRGEPFPGLRR